MAPLNSIVAAHLLLTESDPPSVYPDSWDTIRYDKVDRLYIHPFEIAVNDHTTTCVLNPDLRHRLARVMSKAREKNAKIQFIAQQQHDPAKGTPAIRDLSPNQLKQYAASVAELMTTYDLDGYDLDYEGQAMAENAPKMMAAIKQELNSLGAKRNKEFYVSMSPGWTDYLTKSFTTFDGKPATLEEVLDCVNVQTYDGGWNRGNYLSHWTDTLGFPPSKLLCGLLPEQSAFGKATVAIPEAEALCSTGYQGDRDALKVSGVLGGLHCWRLNSHNMNYENAVQVVLFDHLHGDPDEPTHRRLQTAVEAAWLDDGKQRAWPVQK